MAVSGSFALCHKCMAMGGKWVGTHPQTGRLLFLELEFQFNETFTSSWTSFKKLALPGGAAAVPAGSQAAAAGQPNAAPAEPTSGRVNGGTNAAPAMPASGLAKAGKKATGPAIAGYDNRKWHSKKHVTCLKQSRIDLCMFHLAKIGFHLHVKHMEKLYASELAQTGFQQT